MNNWSFDEYQNSFPQLKSFLLIFDGCELVAG